MIKTLLIVAIIVVSVLIGVVINKYLVVRKNIYDDFKDMIQTIKSEISFLKTEKLSLLKNYKCKNKNVEDFLNNYISCGQANISFLKQEENEELLKLLNSIGKSNIEGELNNLEYYEGVIIKNCRNAQEKYDKYGTFSIKLSILFGALVAIILI